MKNLKSIFALLVLLGSTGIASANGVCVTNPGPQVSASVSLPGFRLVLGRPGIYGWYQGHYYSRVAWDRFNRLRRERERVAYRYQRGHDRDDVRHFDRDRDIHRN